jgi:hypothetical protein
MRNIRKTGLTYATRLDDYLPTCWTMASVSEHFAPLPRLTLSFFDGKDEDVGKVRVTEAYLTTQRDFLKAWASFLQESQGLSYKVKGELSFSEEDSLKENDCDEETDTVEIQSGPGPGRDRRRKRQKNHREPNGSRPKEQSRSDSDSKSVSNSQGKQRTHVAADEAKLCSEDDDVPTLADSSPDSAGSCTKIPLPFRFNVERYDFEADFVTFYDPVEFKIGEVLGTGRNGDVFQSEFIHTSGFKEEVAVKQFDLFKNFDSHQREVEAYKYLKGAWGKLIPEPKFIGASRSGMVRFLGLQKGTSPEGDINAELNKVLATLRKEYNFTHLDSSYGRNAIYVQGDNRNTRKLLVVNLEDWEKYY